MMNPATLMKMMSAKKKFTANHPKFAAFLKAAFGNGIQEGTVIEIIVKRPDGEEMATNFKVLQEDLELMQELQSLAK